MPLQEMNKVIGAVIGILIIAGGAWAYLRMSQPEETGNMMHDKAASPADTMMHDTAASSSDSMMHATSSDAMMAH